MEVREHVQCKLIELCNTEPNKSVFAKRVNASRTNVDHWLAGRSAPTIDKLMEIANIYNINVSDFFPPEEDYEPGTCVRKSNDSDNEQSLISAFRRLNDGGRAFLMECAANAIASGRYDAK